MKKLIIILFAGAAVFSLAQIALADTITTLDSWGYYQTGSGGEFALLPSDPSIALVNLNNYASTTKNILQTGTFQTFCLEHGEEINLGNVYEASLSNNAIAGGVAGTGGDPIS